MKTFDYGHNPEPLPTEQPEPLVLDAVATVDANTPGGFVGPPLPPPYRHQSHTRPKAEDFYNHVFACSQCYAPRNRYCPGGARLRATYYNMRRQP